MKEFGRKKDHRNALNLQRKRDLLRHQTVLDLQHKRKLAEKNIKGRLASATKTFLVRTCNQTD